MRWAVAFAVMTLAACSTGPETQEQVCARQADNDPVVRDMLTKQAGSPYLEYSQQGQLRDAKKDATLACLRARGLAPKGGVERLKP